MTYTPKMTHTPQNEPYAEMTHTPKIGPSGVRALPLAAGINVGGHYKWHFCLFFSLSLFRLIANSPRRGCRRVLQFCLGSKVTKIFGFQPRKIRGGV
jgi:hypothetical protein